jgi:hypothetical protein
VPDTSSAVGPCSSARSTEDPTQEEDVPPEFVCPISGELMPDPGAPTPRSRLPSTPGLRVPAGICCTGGGGGGRWYRWWRPGSAV